MNSCLICGSSKLHIFEQYSSFNGITSDCKPWPRAGRFMICKDCGLIQKDISAQWLKDIRKIYATYEMYPLSNGSEPLIFAEDGTSRPRSGVLLDGLIPQLSLPEQGRILDVGCGNGSLLRQFHQRRPAWELYGHEQAGREEDILSIPGVRNFYSGNIKGIKQSFDLIIMTYVIEHLTEPVEVLKQLRGLLCSGGHMVVHTSSYESNPFDLMVCDHCAHFTPQTLSALAAQAGLCQTGTTDTLLAKEIGFIARRGTPRQVTNDAQKSMKSAADSLRWLKNLSELAKQKSQKHQVGIFGTAVAGTWLAGSLGSGAGFFVDEDPSRQGRTHMGLPVIGPADIPEGSAVIMGFNAELGSRIAVRINRDFPQIEFIIPETQQT